MNAPKVREPAGRAATPPLKDAGESRLDELRRALADGVASGPAAAARTAQEIKAAGRARLAETRGD